MPIYLCYDPYKRTTPWTAEKHMSMTKEFSRRRIKYFSISSPEELSNYLSLYPSEPSSIVFFPGGEKQYKYLFERYKDFNIHKILFSHHNIRVAESEFSSVTSDYSGDMKAALSHLKEKGCKNIALFSPTLNSYHDSIRTETYRRFVENEPLIFTTPQKVYNSLCEMMKCDKKIDAIICINDFIAFCLMLILDAIDADWQKKLLLISFSNTVLSGLCTPSLSSLSLNYTDGGKEVATIHRAVEKSSKIAYMHIAMKSSLYSRATTQTQTPAGMVFSEYPPFDKDEYERIIAPQKKCMALEKLLAASDATVLSIIHGLITDKTLEDIAQKLYLS